MTWCGGAPSADAFGPIALSRRGVGKRREEIDRVVVWVDDLRVALAPEGVPRFLLRSKAGRDHPRVRRVDVAGGGALKGEAHAVPCRLGPVRVKLLDEL